MASMGPTAVNQHAVQAVLVFHCTIRVIRLKRSVIDIQIKFVVEFVVGINLEKDEICLWKSKCGYLNHQITNGVVIESLEM